MRKLFTFFVAVLASMAMMAQEQICFATLESIDKNNNETGIQQTGCTMAWLGITSDKDFVEIDGHKYYKFSSDNSYVRLKLNNNEAFEEGDIVSIAVAANSSKTVAVAFSSGNTTTSAAVSATEAAIVTRTLLAADIEADGSIKMSRGGNSNMRVCSFKVEREAATTDPVLNVSMDTIDINLTAAIPTEMHTVTFSGKNLIPGTYALNVPNLAGLSANPTSVTVGADGKLNAEVALTYTSQVNVAAGVAAVSLSIDNLSAQVVIRYSADLTINYATSVNIEQWVLDNGKNDAVFHAVLSAAHIDFENVNELDSLNDEKANRNYPYLGLKLKAEGANMGCWLQQGSSIKVRLGNVGDPILVAVNGQTSEMTAADLQNNNPEDDKVLSFPADGSQVIADTYVQIITKSAKTVVIKQIMINEDIAAVVLPVQTAIDNTLAAPKATKRILNGQVVIEKNGKFYDLLGTELR